MLLSKLDLLRSALLCTSSDKHNLIPCHAHDLHYFSVSLKMLCLHIFICGIIVTMFLHCYYLIFVFFFFFFFQIIYICSVLIYSIFFPGLLQQPNFLTGIIKVWSYLITFLFICCGKVCEGFAEARSCAMHRSEKISSKFPFILPFLDNAILCSRFCQWPFGEWITVRWSRNKWCCKVTKSVIAVCEWDLEERETGGQRGSAGVRCSVWGQTW